MQYGVPDFQARLEEEVRSRTQGPDEPISSFISNLTLLLDKVVPKMSLEAQLERTYRNLHPSLYRSIFREQFKTFEELQILGPPEEMRREKEKTYRPPLPPESSLFPHFAYKIKKRSKAAIISTTDMEMEDKVAAVKEVSNDYPISKRRERNGTAQSDATKGAMQQKGRRQSNEIVRDKRTKKCQREGTNQHQRTIPRLTSNGREQGHLRRTNAEYARKKDIGQEVVKKDEAFSATDVDIQGLSLQHTQTAAIQLKKQRSQSDGSALASVGSPIQSERKLVKSCFSSPPSCPTAAVGHVDNRLYVNIEIHGRVFPALLDSGAIASFLGPKPAELVKSCITPCSTYMVMANSQTDKIVGEV